MTHTNAEQGPQYHRKTPQEDSANQYADYLELESEPLLGNKTKYVLIDRNEEGKDIDSMSSSSFVLSRRTIDIPVDKVLKWAFYIVGGLSAVYIIVHVLSWIIKGIVHGANELSVVWTNFVQSEVWKIPVIITLSIVALILIFRIVRQGIRDKVPFDDVFTRQTKSEEYERMTYEKFTYEKKSRQR